MNDLKYLDYASTTPLDEDAAKMLIKISTKYYANASSLHDMGDSARKILENCRNEWGQLLNVDKSGIYFTSGGSESNHLILHSLLLSKKQTNGKHIITGMAEHASIHTTMNLLEKQGYEITSLPLQENGLINLNMLKKAIRNDTVLVTIQHINSEIGAIQPIEDIGALCKKSSILFHSDMVQSMGKVDISEITKFVDALSISSHKFYGPKGVGIAYINPSISWYPYYPQTSHENGFRPGTINTAGIASMTVAAQKACLNQGEEKERLFHLRSVLKERMNHPSVEIVECENQYPGIIGMLVKGIEGQWLMLEANRKGFAISTGSACQVGKQAPSKTMKALGLSDGAAKEFIRISLGKENTEEDIVEFASVLLEILENSGVVM